jgi:hypothetical protein
MKEIKESKLKQRQHMDTSVLLEIFHHSGIFLRCLLALSWAESKRSEITNVIQVSYIQFLEEALQWTLYKLFIGQKILLGPSDNAVAVH